MVGAEDGFYLASIVISQFVLARGIAAYKSLIQKALTGDNDFEEDEAFNGTTVYLMESPTLKSHGPRVTPQI